MRVRIAALVAIAVLIVDIPVADASQADLIKAQRRANGAAADLARAESRLSAVQSQLADIEARKQAAEQQLVSLRSTVREVAVGQYIRGTRQVSPLDVDPAVASAQVRADALARIVAAGSTDAADRFRAVAEDLAISEARLAAARKANAGALAAYRSRARAAQAQLAKLKRFEADRIRRDRARRSVVPRRRRGSFIIGSGSWICPVQGPRAFSDDYGDPRGGGRRRHEGNDILSPRGTPVVASVSGVASRHPNRLGGLSYYLHGDDGNTYYGAHLESFSDASGQVVAGTVLGYVGNSGDARGGPTHLHFEIHPGGGGAVNPYPTLRTYC